MGVARPRGAPHKGVNMRRLLPSLICLALGAAVLRAGEEQDMKFVAWLLKFQPLDVNSLIVERESGRGRLDWYMVYSVKNEGDEARPCSLRITAEMLDSEDAAADPELEAIGLGSKNVKKAADILLPRVEAAVERKLGESLLGPADIVPLRRKALAAEGAEKDTALEKLQELATIQPKEVKRCIATFGALDGQADVVKIYVRNLTGTIGVKVREGKRILTEYVLVLTYRIPGDEFGMVEDPFRYVGKKWIKVERELPNVPSEILGTE
jgi:hypothetical protein